MGDVLRQHGLIGDGREVWVADHFRAIADLAVSALQNDAACPMTQRLLNSEINAWLNTPEELGRLRNDFLLPIRGQLASTMLETWDRWLAGIGYTE